MDSLPESIIAQLSSSAVADGLVPLISALLRSTREISEGLRHLHFSSDSVGTRNQFGDHQLDADVKADEVIFRHLRLSGLVHVASSEEKPAEVDCGGKGYSVAFDPLDGSSIIDANFAVGTIVGVWPGNGLLNRTGRQQAASLVAQYGPRVTIALALNTISTISGESLSLELTMLPEKWDLSVPRIIIAPKAKTFAPGNLRATADNLAYLALVNYWIANKYTLRYSGGLVPDVYHILIKGEGVLSNASSPAAKAKLRLLFEAAPIALIVEAAQGMSLACPSEAGEEMGIVSILDIPISDLDKRIGVCYGSSIEVERFRSYIFAEKA
jgi:sedoheptulose-bisphosphatase